MASQSFEFLQAIFDALPQPIFIVDADLRVEAMNLAAQPLVGQAPSIVYRQRGGEVLHCVHRNDHPGGCGKGRACTTCAVRQSVNAAFLQQRIVRRPTTMVLDGPTGPKEVHLLVTTAPLTFEGKNAVVLTLEEVSELVQLRRLIPICAWCKKVRDEEEYWESVESYLKEHLDLNFTHGICPDCLAERNPEMARNLSPSSVPVRSR
jgi:hypothetical protein